MEKKRENIITVVYFDNRVQEISKSCYITNTSIRLRATHTHTLTHIGKYTDARPTLIFIFSLLCCCRHFSWLFENWRDFHRLFGYSRSIKLTLHSNCANAENDTDRIYYRVLLSIYTILNN